MKILKNIFVGFLVSFIGSIPLGYLNVVGFEIYKQRGLDQTVFYLLGVISIEFFVIYFTLLFAENLTNNKKLLQFIECFSVLFMFILAYIFYSSGNSESINKTIFSTISQNFFIAGVLLSCTNFIQIPFWLSWNLYLLNGNFIETSNSRKYFYVFGTVTGTFIGMMALIISLNYLSLQIDFLSKYLIKCIIPIVFVGLGIYQGIKFHNKFYRS